MPLWSDDFTNCSLDDVVRWREANRAWSKELRQAAAALVNSRLTKRISLEEYSCQRIIGNSEAAECQRRTAIILKEIWMREATRAEAAVP